MKEDSHNMFFGDYNVTHTTSSGADIKTSLPALLELMKTIPEKPRILTMDIKTMLGRILPKNTIMLSPDVAEALEQAFEDKQ